MISDIALTRIAPKAMVKPIARKIVLKKQATIDELLNL
jgi:hypothetical protein